MADGQRPRPEPVTEAQGAPGPVTRAASEPVAAAGPWTHQAAANDKPRITRFREGKWGRRNRHLRSSRLYLLLIILATIYAVFMDDVRLAAFPARYDAVVDALFFPCFGVFAVDILLSALFDRRYIRSVVFVLDLVATASILLPVLQNDLAGQDSRGLGLARLARVVRLMRVLRATKFAAVSSTAALSEGDKRRRKASARAGTPNQARPLWEEAVSMLHNNNNNTGRTPPPSNPPSLGSASGNKMTRHSTPESSTPGSAAPRRVSLIGASSFKASPKEALTLFAGSARKLSTGSVEENLAALPGSSRRGSRDGSWWQHPSNLSTTTGSDDGDGDGPVQPSHIGPALVNSTTSNIILLVLFLAVGLNLLEHAVPDRAPRNGLRLLHEAFPTFDDQLCFASPRNTSRTHCVETACCESWDGAMGQFFEGLTELNQALHVKYLRVRGVVFVDSSYGSLRKASVLKEDVEGSALVVDLSGVRAVVAAWSIAQTLLFMVMLMVFPYVFGRDVLSLVVTPLEIIFDRVGHISDNPFSPVEVGSMSQSETFEIDLISESLNRLTKLLQIGLGEAGSQIIQRNLKSGTFSALQAGSLVHGVFGFFDIRNFTDCCEVLQEECVEFVNAIAGVIAFHLANSPGAVNKNIGDAFLAVWKAPASAQADGAPDPANQRALQESAESALTACSRIAHDISRIESVQRFSHALKPRLGNEFRVKVGVGLHFGWAIEGAVGSELKIDATYLSHHIGITEMLEGLTKTYRVPLLMSQSFYDHLTSSTQAQCRMVDCIRVQGLAAEERAVVVAPQVPLLEPDPDARHNDANAIIEEEEEEEGEGDVDKEGVGAHEEKSEGSRVEPPQTHRILTLWTLEIDALQLERAEQSKDYMRLYLQGDWASAKQAVEEFRGNWAADGPAAAVFRFMQERDFAAPADWQGWRDAS